MWWTRQVIGASHRKWREAKMVARGLRSANHPILAQIVPIRRCNLSCTYCNEFDRDSPPVPYETMCERIDHLARLGTANIEISGGEPLLHPSLDDLIRHIRSTGALAGVITTDICSTNGASSASIAPDWITCRSASTT